MTFSLDFFAALRRMKAGAADPPVPVLPDTDTPRPMAAGRSPGAIGPAGLNLIKRFEGCARARPDGRFEAYPDPGTGGDPWTIGWGATGRGIGPGTVWTLAECDARLARDLARFARDVARAGRGPHQPPAVRRSRQLSLQHRCNRPGNADQIAQDRPV